MTSAEGKDSKDDGGDGGAAATVEVTEAGRGRTQERALLGRGWVLVALYAGVAMAVTWPLVAHLGDAMTYGAELTRTVPLFNLWTMEWNQLQVGDLYAHYWNAPIFHPTAGAFALSEPQPLTGLAFAPISWLSGNPVLGYNVVALLILALNGYAGARLARVLGAAPGSAALIGVMAVGLPFVAHQMGALQLTAVFGLLLLIEAILRWAPGGGSWPAARIGIWLAVTFLTCGYYGLLALVGVGVVTAVLARGDWLSLQRLADLAVAGGTFAVLALPIVLGQARYTSEYHRSDDTIRELSASAGDYWRLDDKALGAGIAPWLQDVPGGHGLYPGTALIALAVAGLLVNVRRAEGSITLDERRRPWFLFVGVCVASILSGGLKLSAFGFHPYEVVRSLVPGYDELRSPSRFAVLGELFLLGLAAYGLDALWRWNRRIGFARRWVKAGPVLATAVVVLGVAEVGIAPVRLFEPEPTARWADWLEEHARGPDRPGQTAVGADIPRSDRPVVAFVPFPPSGRVVEFQLTAERMVQAVGTGLTTVNGYSGLFPEKYERLTNVMYGYPSEQADAVLRGYGVQYLVVSTSWMNRDTKRSSWLVTHHAKLYDDGETVIFQLL
ncbi:MAG: hypothetical protein M3433_02330 [Actinomycetota bacterium]|nr:hypothetical protein [Actinomycetota bacterium]